MTTIGDRLARVRVRVHTPAPCSTKAPRGIPDGTTTHRERKEVIGLPTCRRCGWPPGGPGCSAAHRLNPATRMWSRREWLRYRRTGQLPAWNYTSRRDRRRVRRGR
jgi:hypothetical protein